MPLEATTIKYEVADDGVYLCTLDKVEAISGPDKFNPGKERTQFKWTFRADKAVNSEGRPFQFTNYTSAQYNPTSTKNTLTTLVHHLYGILDDVKGIDWEKLVGKKFNVNVAVGEKGYNDVLSVKKVKGAVDGYYDSPLPKGKSGAGRESEPTAAGSGVASAKPAGKPAAGDVEVDPFDED